MTEPIKPPTMNEKSYILDAHRTVLAQQGSETVLQNDCNLDTEEIFQDEKGTKLTTGLKFASFNYINSIVGSGVIELRKENKLTTGLKLASFNHINFIVGSGVIGIPYALHQAGFGMGFLLLLFVALVTDYSLRLMVRSAHISGSFSYQGLMEAAFGKPGFYLLTVLQFIYPFIAMVSYNVVVGDTVTKVLIRMFSLSHEDLLARRDFVVLLATIFVTIPLCLFKDMARLARASLVSLFFVIFILAVIILRLFTLHDILIYWGVLMAMVWFDRDTRAYAFYQKQATKEPVTENAYRFFNWDLVPAIGIMAFAFMCHHNVFLLYDSIEAVDKRVWDTITHYSVFVAFLVTLSFGITGYVTFTGNVQGDLLENYCWDDDLINAARIAFSATILLTYPIECLVTRSVLNQVFESDGSSTHHYLTTIGIVGVTYIISVSTDCLGLVLELNGVFTAVPLAFVLPAISYLKLEEGSILSKEKLPALGLAFFGLIVACFGAGQIFAHFDRVDNCSHGSIMEYCIALPKSQNLTHSH